MGEWIMQVTCTLQTWLMHSAGHCIQTVLTKSKDKEYMVVKIIYVFGTAVPFCQAESMVWVTKGKFNI